MGGTNVLQNRAGAADEGDAGNADAREASAAQAARHVVEEHVARVLEAGLLALLVQKYVYLLYEYKSTDTDEAAHRGAMKAALLF